MPVTRTRASKARDSDKRPSPKPSVAKRIKGARYAHKPKSKSGLSALENQAREDTIQAAINDYNSGTSSYEEVAERHGISTTTLFNRAKGVTQSRHASHLKQRWLNDEEEAVLIEWAKFLSLAGIPWTYETIRIKAFDVRGVSPSRKWIRRFLERHPELRPSKGSGLDKKRASSFNFPVVNKYFKDLMTVFGGKIPPRNLYNFDEIGIQLGGGRTNNGRVHLFHVKDKARYRVNSDDLELVTVLETVCADGTAPVKPCFVFSGKGNQCAEWYEEDDEIFVTTSPTGWTNDDVCAAWFIRCFVEQSKKHSDPNHPIVLIYDGHGSHLTERMIDAARENNIILVLLPAHTTHRLQPCDVGAFGPLKRHWYDLCNMFLSITRTQVAAKDVVMVYVLARNTAFTSKTIESAWRRSGIGVDANGFCTCTPELFTAEDFAPSISFSTKAKLPETFPEWELDPLDMPSVIPDWALVPEELSQPQLSMEIQTTGFDTRDSDSESTGDESGGEEIHDTAHEGKVIGLEGHDHDTNVRDSDRLHHPDDPETLDPMHIRQILSERLSQTSSTPPARRSPPDADPLSAAWALLHNFVSPTSQISIPELHDQMHAILGPHYHEEDWSDAYNVVSIEPGGDYDAAHAALDRLRAQGTVNTTSLRAAGALPHPRIPVAPPKNDATHEILGRAESLRASLLNRLSSRYGTDRATLSSKLTHRSSRHDDPLSDGEDEPDDPDAKLAHYMNKALRYKTLCLSARSQRDRAETHCVLARGLIESLQQQLNSKTSKKRRNVTVASGIISSEEGKRLAHEQAQRREEKKAQEQIRDNARAIALTEKLKRREVGREHFVFTGGKSLKAMKKHELEDVAWVLSLSEDGRMKDLLHRIDTHFEANPGLRQEPRFAQLFAMGQVGRRPRRQPTPPPITSNSVLDEVTNTPRRRRITSILSPQPLLLPPQLSFTTTPVKGAVGGKGRPLAHTVHATPDSAIIELRGR